MGTRHPNSTIFESNPSSQLRNSPSTSRTISQASVSDAISRLQWEKASVQQALDRCKADYKDLNKRFDKLLGEQDHLAAQDAEQRQMIKSLHTELGGDAELDDDDDDDSYMRSIKRGCERRVTETEERLKRFTSEMNKKLESQ